MLRFFHSWFQKENLLGWYKIFLPMEKKSWRREGLGHKKR